MARPKKGETAPFPQAKYGPELTKKICDLLEACNSRSVTCALAGIASSTFYKWLDEHPEFKISVDKSEAIAAQKLVAHMVQFSASDWRAASWMLERKDPSWRKPQEVDITSGGDKISFTIDFGRELTPEELGEE